MAVRGVSDTKAQPANFNRIGGALSSLAVFWLAERVWSIGRERGDGLLIGLSFVVFALFFVIAFETFSAGLPHRYSIHVVAVIVIALVVYAYGYATVVGVPPLTDELVLSVSASQEVAHGHDPYGVDLMSLHRGERFAPGFLTLTESGVPVSTEPYPALSVLLYLPATLLHFNPLWIGYATFIASVITLAALAPAPLRTLAPLALFINPSSLEYVGNGVEDILYVVPLMLAAFLWTETPVLAGLALGIACAVKQVPWLEIPFFAIGVFASAVGTFQERSRRTFAALLAIVAAFVALNLPFIVTKPAAWLTGVLQPITSRYVESGIGLVSLNLSADMHLPRWLLAAFAGAIYLAFLIVGWRFFSRLRNALWLAPGLALFVAPRSLENYFMYLIPIAVASWCGQQAIRQGDGRLGGAAEVAVA